MRVSGLKGAPAFGKPLFASLEEAKYCSRLTIFLSGRVLWARSPRQRARTENYIRRDLGERPLYRINVRLK